MKQTIIRGAFALTILLFAFAGCKKEEQKKGAIKGLEKISLDLQINKDQAEKAALGVEKTKGKKGKAFGQDTIKNTGSLNTIAFIVGVNFSMAALAVKTGNKEWFSDAMEGIKAFGQRLGTKVGSYDWGNDLVTLSDGVTNGTLTVEQGMHIFNTAVYLKAGVKVDIDGFVATLSEYNRIFGSQFNAETKEDIEMAVKEIKSGMGEEDNSKYADLLIKIADRINIM